MSGTDSVKVAETKPTKIAESFDKDKFATYLRNNVSTKTYGEGACAKHVRLALFDAGRKLVSWPAPAKDWGGSLLSLGFYTVSSTDYTPLKGDIVVIQAPKSATNKNGHMQGYDGKAWISDFVQAAFWPGPAYRTDKPGYVIYRY